jgi:hypothetical protein
MFAISNALFIAYNFPYNCFYWIFKIPCNTIRTNHLGYACSVYEETETITALLFSFQAFHGVYYCSLYELGTYC